MITPRESARMEWRQFVMNLESLDAERVEAVFARHGAQAITFSDGGDHAVLIADARDTPLWPDSRITGLFSAGTDLDSLKEDLIQSLDLRSLPDHHVEELADRAWEREWLRRLRPLRFGDRLWVSPDRIEIDIDDAVVVRLDPGLAFGTGSHPSTALCLNWLQGLDLSGLSVLDYGCGSGILAIAALSLGARSAAAVDTDSQAVTATRENAQKNRLQDRLFVTQDVAEVGRVFDIVVANILAGPLIHNAAEICDRLAPAGRLALSGILAEQAGAVVEAYADRIAFEPAVEQQTTDETWVCLTGKRI